MSSSRQSATTSAYRLWFPFVRHSEQDSERKRSRQASQKAGQASNGQVKQKSSSRSRQPDAVNVPPPGAPSAGSQPPKPQAPTDIPVQDPSTTATSSSRRAKPQPQLPRSAAPTAATTSNMAPPDVVRVEASDPRARPPKRTRTHADKIAMAVNSEQESSADENIRRLTRARRAPEGGPLATSPVVLAPPTPVIDQSANARPSASVSRHDPDREERHRRRREERARLALDQAKAEQETRLRARAEVENTAKLVKPFRREPLQEYDSSDSARRKPRVTSPQSKSRTAQEEIISMANVRLMY